MVGGKVQWEGRAVPSDDESDLSGVGSGSDEEYLADAMSDRLNLTVKLGSFKDLAGPPAMFQINSGDVDEFLSRANKTVAEAGERADDAQSGFGGEAPVSSEARQVAAKESDSPTDDERPVVEGVGEGSIASDDAPVDYGLSEIRGASSSRARAVARAVKAAVVVAGLCVALPVAGLEALFWKARLLRDDLRRRTAYWRSARPLF
ncbi:Uncharacterized protein PBTT_00289 [Plasmodiophora brassicae]